MLQVQPLKTKQNKKFANQLLLVSNLDRVLIKIDFMNLYHSFCVLQIKKLFLSSLRVFSIVVALVWIVTNIEGALDFKEFKWMQYLRFSSRIFPGKR